MAQPTTQARFTIPRSHPQRTGRRGSVSLRRLGVTSLGLFGSYARNEQTPESDADFWLVTIAPLTFRAYMDVKLLLEARLALPVDLVLADDLRPRLREHVLSEVIYTLANVSAQP